MKWILVLGMFTGYGSGLSNSMVVAPNTFSTEESCYATGQEWKDRKPLAFSSYFVCLPVFEE